MVGRKVRQFDEVLIVGFTRSLEHVAEVCFCVGPGQQRSTEVNFLENGVNDVARFGIYKEDVVVAEFLQVVANNRVVFLMNAAVVTAIVSGRQQVFLTSRVRIRRDVEVLQCQDCRTRRPECRKLSVFIQIGVQARQEFVTVIIAKS